jgi:hypothetical protein
MDIFEPNLSSAAVILKRDMASRGVEITHKEALEIAAHMRGYQSHAAWTAHEKEKAETEPPVLRRVIQHGVGSDYRYVGDFPGSIWIAVRNIDVHISCHEDGIQIETSPTGTETDARFGEMTVEYAEAAQQFLSDAAVLDMSYEIVPIIRDAGYSVEELEDGSFGVKAKALKGIRTSTFETEEEALFACYAHLFSGEPVLTIDSSDRYEVIGNRLGSDEVILTLKPEDFRTQSDGRDTMQYLVPAYTYAHVIKQPKTEKGRYRVRFASGCVVELTLAELQDPKRFRVVKELDSAMFGWGHGSQLES